MEDVEVGGVKEDEKDEKVRLDSVIEKGGNGGGPPGGEGWRRW